MPRSLTMLAVFTLGIGLAACGSVTGTPTSTSGNASTTASSKPNLYGAPHVAHPLNTTAFQKKPCSMLTAAQLKRLHADPSVLLATRTTASNHPGGGPSCGHLGGGVGTTGSIELLTAGDGLKNLYGQRNDFGVFKILPPVEGYPAVIAMVGHDDRSQGHCSLEVGITDSLIVQLDMHVYDGPDKTKQCTPTATIAHVVLKTLKGGS
ncbi:MAG: DUF3558 domain-containing protein [Sciscionella sp.]